MKRVQANGLYSSLKDLHSALGKVLSNIQAEDKSQTITVHQNSSKKTVVASHQDSTRKYYKGLEGIPEGTVLTTRVRVGKNRKPVLVQGVIRDGKLYLHGRTNGHTSLAKALCSARGLVGADRHGVTTNGIQAWHINGVSVYNYRRMLSHSKA